MARPYAYIGAAAAQPLTVRTLRPPGSGKGTEDRAVHVPLAAVHAAPRYLLWDFGNTLADQRWMWPSPPGAPEWTDRYRALAGTDLDGRWNRGECTWRDVASALTADLAIAPGDVHAHVEQCCRNVQFFEHAWSVARSRVVPQAIVTVNSDLFRDLVVPAYELDTVFDVIVTSGEEHTLDKAELAAVALRRLGGTEPAEALLLDDVPANCDAWKARGGRAYLFETDAAFARDRPWSAPEHA